MKAIVLDTETSGLKDAGVCEIGWFELAPDATVIEQVESLIDPERPITPSASSVHGIVDEDVENSPTLEEFFSLDSDGCYGKRLVGDPVIFCGHKTAFDLPFVQPYIDGPVLEICTLRWFRSLYPFSDSHTLGTAVYSLGLPRDHRNAHRVLSDVTDAYNLLLHIMQRTGLSLHELALKSQEPMLVHFIPFGKHRGEAFSDIPRSYLNWVRNNIHDLDQDTSYTIDYWLGNKGEKQ